MLYERIGASDKSLVIFPSLGHLAAADEQTKDAVSQEALSWLSTHIGVLSSPKPPASNRSSVHFADAPPFYSSAPPSPVVAQGPVSTNAGADIVDADRDLEHGGVSLEEVDAAVKSAPKSAAKRLSQITSPLSSILVKTGDKKAIYTLSSLTLPMLPYSGRK